MCLSLCSEKLGRTKPITPPPKTPRRKPVITQNFLPSAHTFCRPFAGNVILAYLRLGDHDSYFTSFGGPCLREFRCQLFNSSRNFLIVVRNGSSKCLHGSSSFLVVFHAPIDICAGRNWRVHHRLRRRRSVRFGQESRRGRPYSLRSAKKRQSRKAQYGRQIWRKVPSDTCVVGNSEQSGQKAHVHLQGSICRGTSAKYTTD